MYPMETRVKIFVLLSIFIGVLIAQQATAKPVTTRMRAEAVKERRIQRLEAHRRNIRQTIDTFRQRMESAFKQLESSIGVFIAAMDRQIEEEKRDMCLFFGRDEYCPEPEEDKIFPVESDLWNVSKFYSPIVGQKKYFWVFNPRHNEQNSCDSLRWVGYDSRIRGEYAADHCMNCQGNCFKPADISVDLRLETPFRVGACPPEYPFGTQFNIQGFGIMTCVDRGGKIKGKRLDIWTGIGTQGMDNYVSSPSSGMRKVTIVK